MKDRTRAVKAGRDPKAHAGIVNAPLYRASTIVFPTYEALKASRKIRPGDGMTYAIHGTPGTYGLEEALTALEAGTGGGHRTRLCNSGLQAVSMPLLGVLSPGDHVLIPDNVYNPCRTFADRQLARLGVEWDFYDPAIGHGIEALIKPNTRIVHTESPGSWTFEMQDIPAIAEAAHAKGALVMTDNTWASGLYFKAFQHGVDISVQALTKYAGGHSDLLMGSVTATEAVYDRWLQQAWRDFGLCASPDDAFLVLRGLRTQPVRMAAQMAAGLEVGGWLKERAEVAEVLHPAMPHDPGHAIWQRDYEGAASLFAITLEERFGSEECIAALLDGLEHFAMGFSWGGYESLIIPVRPETARSATAWPRPGRPAGPTLRLHIGLEDTEDLMADLDAGFARMRAAA